MKKSTFLNNSAIISAILAIGLLLVGCSDRATPTPSATPIPPTPEATATSTPAPARLVLYDPTGVSSETLVSMLSEFAGSNALLFETWADLSIPLDGVKIMVVNATLENLSEKAATAPMTQFVVLNQTVTPGTNISLVTANPVHVAFMEGYLAAMTSEEWRIGALLVDDTNLGLVDAFIHGGQYLCGPCTPQYSPMLNYPQVYTLTNLSDVNAWAAQATALLTETAANSVFIERGGDIPEVLDQFPDAVLYSSNPASANLSRYAAVVGADVVPALQQILPDLLAGIGSKTVNALVSLVAVNKPDLVTPGKQANFNEVAQNLANGWIIPNSIP